MAKSETGDDVALKAAITGLRPELLAVARYLLVSEDDAQDLAQQTIEIALRHHRELRDAAKLRAWMFAIEAREISRWRRRVRSMLRLDNVLGEVPASAPSPDRSIAVRIAVERLPPRTRIAVVLHYMSGLSVTDTARALGVSENTVKTQLRLGLTKLRDELA